MNAPPKFPAKFPGPVTMTSREFNQHTGRAKAAADQGPVIITDRGKPAYVFTTYEDYSASHPVPERVPLSAAEAFADPNYRAGDLDIMDFIPPRQVEPLRFSFDEDE